MVSEMIERVARALMTVVAAAPASDGTLLPVLAMDPDFDDLPRDHTEGTSDDEITQEAVIRLALAAIAAMREPTNGMGYAGLIATNGDSLEGWPDDDRRAAFKALGDIGYGDCIAGNPSRWKKPIWRAMIDAALGGPDGA